MKESEEKANIRIDETEIYEIRLRGHLEARWAGRFEGLRLHRESGGTSTLTGPVADQAALHGYLRIVRDLGVPLLSVTTVPLKEEKEA